MLILLRHAPTAYHPPSLFDDTKQVNPYLTHIIMPALYNGIESGKPFSLTIEEEPLNQAIASYGWPQAHGSLLISTPMLFLRENELTGMTGVNLNGVDTVITVQIHPEFDPNGLLNLKLQKVRAGAISLTMLVKPIAKRMYNDRMAAMEGHQDFYSNILGSILAEKPFEPTFKVGKRTLKITNITIHNKTAKLDFAIKH